MSKVDKQELRRLAEAAKCGDWYIHGLDADDDRFTAAATPAAILSLLDELEQYRKDAERLNLLADHIVIEGFVGVEEDIYDISCEVAESNGREEPSDDDQRQALRLLIDAFCAKEGGANG